MRLRKAWLISSFGFFALFVTVCAVIILRGGNPITNADRAAEAMVTNIIAPVESAGVYRLLSLDDNSNWQELPADDALPERVVLLLHGLDEPGTIFDDLAPAIEAEGLTPLYFEYPNDQRIADSAPLLHVALRQLRTRGVVRVDLVCHSMGGLVSRDCLTRDTMYAGDATGGDGLPAVERWITVGTPFDGAPLAGLRFIAEWREQAVRWTGAILDGEETPEGRLADGAGEAGEDLAPESPFLTELNERPWPTGLQFTVIYSELAPGVQVGGLGTEIGDGVVPVWSAVPAGIPDTVKLTGNHRSMLKSAAIEQSVRDAAGAEPRVAPAIPVILDRLSREAASSEPGSP